MASAGAPRRCGQDGAAVVEFAIVFALFVMLVSGLIQYGAIFAVQQSITHAAAEGTRAAVNVVDPFEADARARAVVADQLSWLPEGSWSVGPNPTVVVPCQSPPYPAGTECVEVEVAYDWANYRLVPMIFRVAVPETLTSRAVIVRN
jgi:hypothetical protein